MAAGAPITVVEHSRVSPPSNSLPSSLSINLSPFDIPFSFILSDATNQSKRLLFYEFPNTLELNHIIHQQLKTSLSLALQKFYPFASKLVFPPFPEKPRILYTVGDSVPFTVAESLMDFSELVGDGIKDVKIFHPFIPMLSPRIRSEDDGTLIVPDLLAIQVTIFPNSGMSIGIHFNHTVADGKGLMYFLKSWTSICRTGSVESSLNPSLQREVIEDVHGLQTMPFLKELSQTFQTKSPPMASNVEVRATFVLSKTKIIQLKEWILNHQLLDSNISSFAAACAFTWVCFVKAKQHGDELAGDIVQLWEFCFMADLRNRLKPPTPETYFGNCLAMCHVCLDEKVLLGQHGIVYAAKAIFEKVRQLDDHNSAVIAFETGFSNMEVSQYGRIMAVTGSPRLEIYDSDFGWGRPKKSPVVHIDAKGAGVIALAESRDEKCGLEIELALERAAMDKFTTLFNSFI